MLNLLKHFGVQRKDIFAYHSVGDPRWTPYKYEALAEEGFQKNVFAYRAINLISKSVSSIPLIAKKVNDTTKNTEDKIIAEILQRPNSNQSRSSFLENIVNYLMISGNAFVHHNDNGELRCLRSDRIQIVPNKSRTAVDYYVYSVDSSKLNLKKEDILHLKLFNPLNDWYGFSPLQAAFRAIDQYNEMSNHNLAVMQNGGRPSGCLVVKNAENLTEEQKIQLRSDIQSAYSGAKNAGKIMIMEGGLEWKEMGKSLKDLDFDSGKNTVAREIAQAFGVPPVLVGIQDSVFMTYKEARLHFWEDTILPMAEFIRLEFSNWLSVKFNKRIEIILDLDAVSALSSRRESLWNKISNADFLTINEKREILGYLPIKE